MNRRLFFIGIGLVVAIVTAGAAGFIITKKNAPKTVAYSKSTPPPIGGKFTLVNGNGKTVTEADFKGRYMLIFFGYTSCPDVCPNTLQAVGETLDIMGKDAAKVAPLFISVDPERDTPKVMKEYVSNFHPGIIGLTGNPEQISSVAKVYQAYFAKVVDESGNKDNYLMDHSAYLYLMGPDGKFVTVFGYQTDPKVVAEQIEKLL